MNSNINVNLQNNINNILGKSKYKILNYKNELIKLYDIIFNYCENNHILISNININMSQILNINYKLYDFDNDFNFNLYSTNPYLDALNISNIIYKKYSKYIVMSSYLRNKEIIITVDNNKLIKIQLLFLYKINDKISNKTSNETINLLDIIEYKQKKIIDIYSEIDKNYKTYNYNIKYTTDLFELLILTHKLYHPSYFLKYNKGDDKLNSYFNSIINNLTIQLDSNIDVNKIEKSNFIYNLRNLVLKEIAKENDLKVVLLDNIAYNFILKVINKDFLTNYNFNDIVHIMIHSKYLDLIKRIINNIIDSKKYSIIIKINTLYLINDFRFKRTNIQLINNESNKKQTLMYIYNNLDYEVIPTICNINKTFYIPHNFVIIRFLLINLYYNKLFNKFYNKDYNKNTIYIIKQLYDKLLEYNKKKEDKIIEYIGIFIDDKIDKFKLGSIVYRPWQYEKKHNTLLTN